VRPSSYHDKRRCRSIAAEKYRRHQHPFGIVGHSKSTSRDQNLTAFVKWLSIGYPKGNQLIRSVFLGRLSSNFTFV
jgi:hypothetical protein